MVESVKNHHQKKTNPRCQNFFGGCNHGNPARENPGLKVKLLVGPTCKIQGNQWLINP